MQQDDRIHYHWDFLAFDGDRDATAVHWAVHVTVLGYATEEEAQVAAAAVVRREHYRLQRVFECSTCAFQTRFAEAQEKLAEGL